MTQRVEAEVMFRFRGALRRTGRPDRTIDKTATVSTDRGAPRRTVRVEDELWTAAVNADPPAWADSVMVDLTGITGLPDAIRRFLRVYVHVASRSGGAAADQST